MSVSINGQQMQCDGEACTATAGVPVALRPSLSPRSGAAPLSGGWLCVMIGGLRRHYCPRCLARYLASLPGQGIDLRKGHTE